MAKITSQRPRENSNTRATPFRGVSDFESPISDTGLDFRGREKGNIGIGEKNPVKNAIGTLLTIRQRRVTNLV
jgi:hypothetical protein